MNDDDIDANDYDDNDANHDGGGVGVDGDDYHHDDFLLLRAVH